MLWLDIGEGISTVGSFASVAFPPLQSRAALYIDRGLLLPPILLPLRTLSAIPFLAFGEVLQPFRQILGNLVMFFPEDLPLLLLLAAELAICREIEHRV